MSEVAQLSEYRKRHVLEQLALARKNGEIAILGASEPTDAVIIPFPSNDPMDAA